MPRLESFTLKIKTGDRGPEALPRYEINGFPVDFDEASGGIAPGDTLEVTGNPQSFPHTLVLTGPGQGVWDIEGIEALYRCGDEEPYAVRLGAASLDDHSDLDIWYTKPDPVIDV
jgi:hypothetical protein